MNFTRRQFLQSAAVFSAMGMAPRFLAHAAEVQAKRAINGYDDDRILVVVQLGGGNDGLNTVVPYANDDYHRARPNLGLKQDQILKLTDEVALNAQLDPLRRLYDEGQLAVVQGVGYPNPDRSHFRSMEIWHTASDSDQFLGHGWIGRYFDNTCSGRARPQVGMAVGNERPQAFEGKKGFGIATEDPDKFGYESGLTLDGVDFEGAFRQANAVKTGGNDTLDFLRHTTENAIRSSKEVQAAADRAGLSGHPGMRKRQSVDQIDLVAGLIRGGLDTRIFYVSTSGFDTHANQAGQHDRLLGNVGDSLARFQAQLEKDGNADRVTTLVFSEFGRRVKENGSAGTDHGTAAPLFVMGKHVNAGIHGTMPSLTDLDDGDLRHTVDFRQVYASLLQDWLSTDSKAVLNKEFEPLRVIA